MKTNANTNRLPAVWATMTILVAASAHAGQMQPRPYTLDDFMAIEATGDGAGQGQRIVWEQAPPYEQIGYYGHSHVGAWGRSGFQLKTVDLSARERSAQPLFEPEPGTSYWIDSFSPDSRYVAFYAARNGVFFMGVYDTQQGIVRTFAATPLVDWYQGRESVWVSPNEFIFCAHEGDVQPLRAQRPYTGQRLAREWQNAWAGKVSVTIDTTGLEDASMPTWKRGRLYKANAGTGALTLLAEGNFENLALSHDGRYLAALRQAVLPPPDPDRPNVDWVKSRSQLTLFDLRKGGPGRAVAPERLVFIETLAWAPDANRLAFFAWNRGEDVQSGYFHAVDADTGTVTPYPHKGLDLASQRERGLAQKPERVTWVHGRLAVFAREHGGEKALFTYRDLIRTELRDSPGKADWFLLDAHGKSENLTERFRGISPIPIHADARSIVILADGDAWRVRPGREPRNLTASVQAALVLPPSRRYWARHRPFGAHAVLVSEDAHEPGFALLDFNADTVALVDSPAPDAELLAGAAEAGAVLFRYDHDAGADLILKHVDGRQIVLDRSNGHMAAVAKTRWRTISYKVTSHVGERTLESCILLPYDYQPGKRYPLIVEIYPSRGASCMHPSRQRYDGIGRRPGPYSEHLLAARGYIVMKPNTVAEVTQTRDGPLGGMQSMVEQGVEALVEQGYADPGRVGLLGASQGGFSSLWLATQSKIFKATVSLNGWSDMYVHYFDSNYFSNFNSDEFGFTGSARRYEATSGTDFPIGRKPHEDPLAYIRPSPVFNAPGVTAPIMLIHSDMDTFPVDQYERMYTALHLQGKKAKLMRYWGEGHGPSSPANIRHMWGEIFEWFDDYVMNAAQHSAGQ